MEMEEACIVSNCLTMQASSFAGRLFLLHAAPWFAYENRFHWLCGQAYANRAGTRAACFLCAARSRHQYAWRMASMMFSAPTMEIPARVNLLFFFGRIIFS